MIKQDQDQDQVRVRVDFENGNNEWWDSLPDEIADRLRATEDVVILSSAEWALVQSLPGWNEGSPCAPTPLLLLEEGVQ